MKGGPHAGLPGLLRGAVDNLDSSRQDRGNAGAAETLAVFVRGAGSSWKGTVAPANELCSILLDGNTETPSRASVSMKSLVGV